MGRAEEPSRYDAAAETRQFRDTQRFERALDTRPIEQLPGNPEPEPGPVANPDPDPDRSRAWEQSDEPGRTHDPHEVTVQLDGVGRELEDWLVQQAKDAPAAGQDSDGPVFVDETGRRRSRLRRIGIVVGLVCAVYAVVIGVTLMSGNSDAPWMPGLGEQDDQPAQQVDTSPLPADPAGPSQTASGSPSAGAPPTAGVTPAPGAGASADPSGEASAPGTSTGPRPSTSPDEPAGDPSPEPPETGEPPSLPDPPDPNTSSDPPPAPSESPDTSGGTGTDPGSGPVAGGPIDPDPVGSGAAASSSSRKNPKNPENPENPENIA